MKTEKIVVLILILVALIVAGGLVALARSPMMPPVQKMEQVIPDDHIPR